MVKQGEGASDQVAKKKTTEVVAGYQESYVAGAEATEQSGKTDRRKSKRKSGAESKLWSIFYALIPSLDPISERTGRPSLTGKFTPILWTSSIILV